MAFSQSIGLLHLSLLGGLGGIVLLVNVASSERPLRSLDRDLFSWLRSDHPDLLRNLDWSSPLWRPWLNLKAMDLSGQDMRGLRMTGNTLRDLNLKGSHLENAELTCVTMHNVDLAGAHLHEAKFDYRNCSSSSQPASGNSPKGGPISAEMKVNLNGADLSQAEIRGGVMDQDQGNCTSRLLIEGNLNGANFSGATLQCVTLKNTTATRNPVPHVMTSSPEYAGLQFGGARVAALKLESGDFNFSDFYRAHLRLLEFDPERVALRFTTLASLQGCERGCRLMESPPSQRFNGKRLSLNVRDSTIISNLLLPAELPPKPSKPSKQPPGSAQGIDWPALMCNSNSVWRLSSPSNQGAAKPAHPQTATGGGHANTGNQASHSDTTKQSDAPKPAQNPEDKVEPPVSGFLIRKPNGGFCKGWP